MSPFQNIPIKEYFSDPEPCHISLDEEVHRNIYDFIDEKQQPIGALNWDTLSSPRDNQDGIYDVLVMGNGCKKW